MKLAVIGSRTFQDKQRLFDILDRNLNVIKLIISGGAAGADTFASIWAQERGVPYLVFPARWRDLEGNYDKGAGFRRNIKIIENCDRVLAFMEKGGSKGTQHSLDIAARLKKPAQVIEFEIEAPKDISTISLNGPSPEEATKEVSALKSSGQTIHNSAPEPQTDSFVPAPLPKAKETFVLPKEIEF